MLTPTSVGTQRSSKKPEKIFHNKTVWQVTGLMMAIFSVLLCHFCGMNSGASWTVGVTVLCALWWVSEAIPIPVTSLVPFAIFPIVGVLSHGQVATAYGHTFILLFMAGFMLSKAAEGTQTHRKIAHTVLMVVGGTTAPRIIFGFMAATAFCSMWISNTATAVMMLPVAVAVLEDDESGKLGIPLLLGIAYAASIGGMATIIGTPPNVALLSIYQEATTREIAFHEWILFGLPISIFMLIIAWLYLSRGVKLNKPLNIPVEKKWTKAQVRVMIVLAITAFLWITRALPIVGWAKWTGITTAGDSTIALVAVVAMFLIPSGDKQGNRLLNWQRASSIPWGILLLFGGGLAIAKAFIASGLTEIVAEQLTVLEGMPVLFVIFILCLVVTLMTEVTSNTATANVFLPIVLAAATAMEIDPIILMVPTAMAASCAFMLPVATPPNAVVFGAGKLRIYDMARYGVVLNVIAIVVISVFSWFFMS
ncbi:Sodium-dependent dicarboxylate transporter SdcS [Poriferisphaera corsica]|uniref:Sodium-dependent dicarboxylate transporter SdcS n=1 Tax=Poriferisphaera corsica TaxID=2528020 RepID=A0A517YQ49_9BACT|nr:SLC13 family permease [Poriferisphaera corsica]QDU32342.1 Sodium-dependent dicarboxylate transporter SdcS [Poriferisphaera corsica]